MLRGSVSTKEKLLVIGYETLGAVSGAPEGISGAPGTLGIYFLRSAGGQYRTIIDVYQSFIPLHPKVDLSIIESNDIPLTVWRLLIYPYSTGLWSAKEINLPYILTQTGFRLGRLRTINLLADLADSSANAEMQIAACSELNQFARGFGVEGCLIRILNNSARILEETQRTLLAWELGHVSESNARIKEALLASDSRVFANGFANTTDWNEVKGLLGLLAKHPSAEIRKIAAQRLIQWNGH